GKVGDLAWLFFAPFALAAVLAWVIPLRDPAREKWAFGLSFAGVGLSFGFVKTVPGLTLLATRISGQALHTPLSLTRDPSDLLALPSLLIGYWLWRKMRAHSAPQASLRGWVALPLAALLTLANSGVPDPGIVCFSAADGKIAAGTGYATFASSDGGATWQPDMVGSGYSCERKFMAEGKDWFEVSALQPDTLYRFRPGDSIQISTNAGQSWQVARDLRSISEARQLYYIKSRQGYAVYEPGPWDAIADPLTGNMLFAMGHQGVLIRTAAGDWTWSRVANYRPLDPFPTADALSLILGGMLYLALGLFLLVYATQALHWAGGTLRIVLVCLAWAAWLLVDILFPPAQSTGYTLVMSSMGVLGILILAVPLALEQTVRLARRAPRALLPLSGFGLLAALLYFLPYVFWLYGSLPTLWWATIFGLFAAGAVLTAAFISARRSPASQPGPKK
ncbi:MAG: hypothetical protein IH586_16465, partial [Anaerolineaceae bacterium]|nr:hypothetical protein [Anaerolineaceae bacterium]